MTIFKHTIGPVILASIWISISEFVRNEYLVKSYWTSHYESLGLVFPSEPINGAMWGIWSLMLAILLYLLSRKFNLVQTAVIGWFAAFAMMWVVIGNLSVLPTGILWMAIPLSLLEAFVASWIITKTSGAKA